MAKFCGNCGLELPDEARVCGGCGTPLIKRIERNNRTSILYGDINYNGNEKRLKVKKYIKKILKYGVFVILLAVAAYVVLNFTGYKGAVRKIIKAYKNYDISILTDMESDLYYWMDDTDYDETYFEEKVSSDLEVFEEMVGRKYTLSYEITDSYVLSKYRLEELMQTLSYYENFEPDIISKVQVVELDIIAEGKENTTIIKRELYLTKENEKWRILYIN